MSEARNRYAYRRSADQDAREPVRHEVVVVGAGPVGLTAALDLAQRGVHVVLIDDNDRIGEGSRAICFSKRTLEILDRLGVADWAVGKGVTWQLGKVFLGDSLLYQFDLLPERGHKMPAFINLQQYYLEARLVEACLAHPLIDLRWRNRAVGIAASPEKALLGIDTPDGRYAVEARFVVAADGARSAIRELMGLGFEGQVFGDRFLIADVKMEADYPTERWFWFDPPFHSGRSALLHRQPDNVWRIDLQLGADADPREEARPERVVPRLKQMLGEREFTLEWVSVYTFQCRRLARFRHGRVVFAGDSAHQVSPFGARGANSGIQDAENLAWKLALVLAGEAPDTLLDSYHTERSAAADENIAHSTRSTDFIAPKGAGATVFRRAALELAATAAFARRLVNSGRLSTPCCYASPLSSADTDFDDDAFGGTARLGAPVPDAPLADGDGKLIWLLNAVSPDFTLIEYTGGSLPQAAVPQDVAHLPIGGDLEDVEGVFAQRFDARPGSCYLVRPDQHLCARWRNPAPGAIEAAVRRARGEDNG